MKKLILFGILIFLALTTQVHASWWSTNYVFKSVIWINTTTENLTASYTANLTNLDTSSLISSEKMKPDCSDLRIVYNDITELDRAVYNCNEVNTFIEFRIKNIIYNNTNDSNYSVYYGYSYPSNSLSDWNNIYLFADNFSSYDSSKWTNNTYGIDELAMNGNFIMNCLQGNSTCDLESKQNNFTLPFSLEMGNTYWNQTGNGVVRRQLNATDWTSDFRAGLYKDGSNQWLWFSINNQPGGGNDCQYDIGNAHNRILKVWNNTRVEYWQDGNMTCNISTNISQNQNWSVDLNLYNAGSGYANMSSDYVIVRKLTNESTKPALGLQAEQSRCNLMTLTNCTGGNITLNFTAYDEDTNALLNYSMDATFSYIAVSSDAVCTKSFSHSYAGNSTFYVCINPSNATGYANATIKYWNSSYNTRYYYLSNASLTNNRQNISLYLLNSSSSTLITINILDQLSNPQPNIVVMIEKENIGNGTYTLVAEEMTDYSGTSYAYLKIGENYKILLTSNGIILREYNPFQLQSTSLTFYTSQSSIPEYFSYFGKVATSCNLDNSTNVLSCNYLDTSGLTMKITFNVTQVTQAGDMSFCSSYSSGASGSFACNLTANSSYKYSLVGTYYSVPNDFLWQSGYINLSSTENIFGAMGLIISLIFIIFMPFLANWDVRIALLLQGVGIIISLWAGFIYGGSNVQLLMILVAVIEGVVIYKIKT